MSNQKYTAEHIAFLAENITGCPFSELTEKFNLKFGLSLSVSAVVSLADRNGLHNGRDAKFNTGWEPTQFKKGHVPANKGKKGVSYPGMKATQFRKGHKPWNYKPVGTERINADGYVDVKVADPNKWRPKHILLWEAAHGPVPAGHALLFGDGNKLNVSMDNLILISRGQLARLNQNGLIQNDADLTRTGIIIADIITQCSRRKQKSSRKAVRGE